MRVDKADGILDRQAVFNSIPAYCAPELIEQEWLAALAGLNKKIIVLDDDPTGVQTVHGIPVYTDWSAESIEQGFSEPQPLFFVLTNSRSLTAAQSREQHRVIAENICLVAQKLQKDYLVISRSDSTLRGHYPLETSVLREVIEQKSQVRFNGEIIIPFFKEGERYTINDIHYIGSNDVLVPAHLSEFAQDVVFGYRNSYLPAWIEEKTGGEYKAGRTISISLEQLRGRRLDGIVAALEQARDFTKIIVNAVDYDDVKVFVTALTKALTAGYNYLFRSAASFVRVVGGIRPKAYLTKADIIRQDDHNGGLVIIGSHVKKTTEQFAAIRGMDGAVFIEVDPCLISRPDELEQRIAEIAGQANQLIANGHDAVIYTSRTLLKADTEQDNMTISAKISGTLVEIMRRITVKPRYIIAKGGITSSDIGTKGLGVKKALVAGQILPGVPVWITGREVALADVPYIIFPGNVGNASSLREVMLKLQ